LLNTYGADAIVTPLISSTYFLATRKNGTVSAKNPSLYRRYFNGTTATIEELVPNIEAINFQYGENTTLQTAGPNIGQPTFQTDVYRAADAVNDWSRVVSVRIGFIMVSEDTNMTPGADNDITWNGGTFTPANTTDHRLRRAYSTTVSIRNRMGV
jgi:type IV pilus assembly protein PilW